MPGSEDGNFKIIVSLPWFVVARYERYSNVIHRERRKNESLQFKIKRDQESNDLSIWGGRINWRRDNNSDLSLRFSCCEVSATI